MRQASMQAYLPLQRYATPRGRFETLYMTAILTVATYVRTDGVHAPNIQNDPHGYIYFMSMVPSARAEHHYY